MVTPHVTLGPVPPCEPPYDHETCCAGNCCGGACLPNLPDTLPSAHPPSDTTRLRPLARGGAGLTPTGPAGTRPRRNALRRPGAANQQAQHATALFMRLYLEVLTGHRTAPQLRSRCTPEAYQQLIQEVEQHPKTIEPVRLLSLRAFAPTSAAIEGTAMLSRTSTVWAVALRLEKFADIWVCAHLQAIRPGWHSSH